MSGDLITLCHMDDVEEGSSKGFSIGNKHIFAVKKDGELHVYYNYCPHLGTPLEWQEDQFLDPDGALIQCSTHGALFLIEDGSCIAGPCKGKSLRRINHVIANQHLLVDSNEVGALGRL